MWEQNLHPFVNQIHRSWQNKVATARSYSKTRYYGNLETYKHCITILFLILKNAPNHLRLRLRQAEAENFSFNLQSPHGYYKYHQFSTLKILHPVHTVSEQTAITSTYGTDRLVFKKKWNAQFTARYGLSLLNMMQFNCGN
jgi:hypothetical protein